MPDDYNINASTTRFQKVRHVVPDDPDYEWFKVAKAKLNHLAQLPLGWNGYAAPPVSLNNATFALNMLSQICTPSTPPPQIVPGVGGNCQVEWHTHDGDLELNVKSPNHVEVWYSVLSANPPLENEILLRNDFTEIVEYLKLITEPAIAHAAAA